VDSPLQLLPIALALTGAKTDERETLLDLLAAECELPRKVIESINETFKRPLDLERTEGAHPEGSWPASCNASSR
jgi:hypothetical protein